MFMGGLRADVGIEGHKKGHTKQSALSALNIDSVTEES